MMAGINSQRLLRDLIALPSVNPAFLAEGHVRAGERRVAEFLASIAAGAGLDIEFQSVSPGRDNLLVRCRPSARVKRTVVLAPHLDTVDGEDGAFVPRVQNGRLYGRGACDTKGSVAAMFGALLDVASGRRPAETEIIFAGLCDEENAQLGSRGFARANPRADLAIIGEPTRLKVVTAHKGSLWLRITTRGKAAHGAMPALGRNAVHAMARAVCWLEGEYAASLKTRAHALLGPPTINVGRIQGGRQANIVPDACEIMVDRRTLPGETERGVIREIASGLSRLGLRVEISSGKGAPCLPMETSPELPLVNRFLESMSCEASGAHYFCDAAIFAEAGTPSVVFGPGDIAQAHTRDEWISLASLEQARRRLARFLTQLP